MQITARFYSNGLLGGRGKTPSAPHRGIFDIESACFLTFLLYHGDLRRITYKTLGGHTRQLSKMHNIEYSSRFCFLNSVFFLAFLFFFVCPPFLARPLSVDSNRLEWITAGALLMARHFSVIGVRSLVTRCWLRPASASLNMRAASTFQPNDASSHSPWNCSASLCKLQENHSPVRNSLL